MDYRDSRLQHNGMGKSGSWTPRGGRGGFHRGDGAAFGSSRGGAGYFHDDQQHNANFSCGQDSNDKGLEKALSGISLGKAFSGSIDGSEGGNRLQRAQSRGLDPSSYPAQRGYQTGPMRGGSGDLGPYSPGRIGGRGEPGASGQWQGRGRGSGPVSSQANNMRSVPCMPCWDPLRHAWDCWMRYRTSQ